MAGTAEIREPETTLEERFIRVIEQNFHGSSEAVQKLIEFGGNEITEFDRGIFTIDIFEPEDSSGTRTRLVFASEEREMEIQIFLLNKRGLYNEHGIKDIQEIKFSNDAGGIDFLTSSRGFRVFKDGRISSEPLKNFC
jgi:hypothetical protein